MRQTQLVAHRELIAQWKRFPVRLCMAKHLTLLIPKGEGTCLKQQNQETNASKISSF